MPLTTLKSMGRAVDFASTPPEAKTAIRKLAIPVAPTQLGAYLLNQVRAGTNVGLALDGDPAVLDEAGQCLGQGRVRVLRAGLDGFGGLTLSAILRNLARQAPSATGKDAQNRGFNALTQLDASCDRIALVVSDADAIERSALDYLKRVQRDNQRLSLILAGPAAGVFAVLDDAGLEASRARVNGGGAGYGGLAAATRMPRPEPIPSPRPFDDGTRLAPGISFAARTEPGAVPEATGRPRGKARSLVVPAAVAAAMAASLAVGVWFGAETWRDTGTADAERGAKSSAPAAPRPEASAPVEKAGSGGKQAPPETSAGVTAPAAPLAAPKEAELAPPAAVTPTESLPFPPPPSAEPPARLTAPPTDSELQAAEDADALPIPPIPPTPPVPASSAATERSSGSERGLGGQANRPLAAEPPSADQAEAPTPIERSVRRAAPEPARIVATPRPSYQDPLDRAYVPPAPVNPPFIGTFTTDANGARVFRPSR